MKSIHMVSFILVMVGAINWGLIGLGDLLGMDLNVVNMIFGSMPMVESVVYLLVGVAAVYELVSHKGMCRQCMGM